jgi:hypothetical protein
MTTSPRDALDRLVAALEAHYEAVTRRTGEADPGVILAYTTLADAFETYDNALYDTFDEVTPFELVPDDDEDEDDDEDDDELDEDDDELDEIDDELDELDDELDEIDDENGDDAAREVPGPAVDGQKRSG